MYGHLMCMCVCVCFIWLMEGWKYRWMSFQKKYSSQVDPNENSQTQKRTQHKHINKPTLIEEIDKHTYNVEQAEKKKNMFVVELTNKVNKHKPKTLNR